MSGKAADKLHSSKTVLENFVVQCNKQRPNVFGLRKMFVEPFMQRREDRMTNARV